MKFVVKSDCSGLMLELLFWGPPLLLPIQQSYDSNALLVVYKRLKTDKHKTLLYIKLEPGRLRKNTFNIYVIAPKL